MLLLRASSPAGVCAPPVAGLVKSGSCHHAALVKPCAMGGSGAPPGPTPLNAVPGVAGDRGGSPPFSLPPARSISDAPQKSAADWWASVATGPPLAGLVKAGSGASPLQMIANSTALDMSPSSELAACTGEKRFDHAISSRRH